MASARSVACMALALACVAMLAWPASWQLTVGERNGLRRLGGQDVAQAQEVQASVVAPVPKAVEPAAAPKMEPLPMASEALSNMTKMLSRGGLGRGAEFWKGVETMSAAAVTGEAQSMGHRYLATTTVYADTNLASCGQLDTRAVVAGTGYYAVASAQAMQNSFPEGSGDYWCGRSTGSGTSTAPMGCMSCAKGRFLKRRPYGAPFHGGHGQIFEQEINVVVVDICPHQGNEVWCPKHVGTTNRFGSHNHFDFANPPAGFDNFYFAFTPAPCSAQIRQRFRQMSQCFR